MDIEEYFKSEFEQHLDVLNKTRAAIAQPFVRLVNESVASIQNGKKILFFGNGGSAGDAQHIATELTVRYKKDRPPIAAIALTTDTSALTAIGNDYGFEDLFSRQIEALCNQGDVAIGISTSGNSENVIRGLVAAKRIGASAAGLGGGNGGRMKDVADPFILVPTNNTARIQEMHITIGHMLCGAIEKKLG